MRHGRWIVLLPSVFACGTDDARATGTASTTLTSTLSSTTEPTGGTDPTTGDAPPTSTTAPSTTGADASTGEVPKFDVGGDTDDGTTGELPPTCHVVDGMDAIGDCTIEAPPDSFDPVVQWSFAGVSPYVSALPVTPVANLTDDNGDGSIDLCDVPDVVAPLYIPGNYSGSGRMWVLDGATGVPHFEIQQAIAPLTPPAVGDIDSDGVPEIITAILDDEFSGQGRLAAFEHDGTPKWVGNTSTQVGYSAVALADLDNDGDVEIMISNHVADHLGQGVVTFPAAIDILQLTTAADLDGDGDLEVVLGASAYHHDGAPYYNVPQIGTGHPQIADIDDDGLPEVIVVGTTGVSIVQHDGTATVVNSAVLGGGNYRRPLAVHDMDGDGRPEIAVGADNVYGVLEHDLSVKWTAPVLDGSGYAAGTAFDFLGAGEAQAMYADETTLFVFDGAGEVLLGTPRSSVTQTENPVVVDVDNDGSAEIVVVSNEGYGDPDPEPAIQVIADAQERWIQARRIWNQHTYHVTNVREDGTIPQFEPPSWEQLNTFRTQAQIEGGGICQPRPRG